MKTIYYGKNYHVYLENDIGRTEASTDLFDGMPEEVIDCYYYIPAGVTWRDSDGDEHTGECIVPSKDLARFASMSKAVYAELDKPRTHFKIATVIVDGAGVTIVDQVPFASGTVGAILGVKFDECWNDLAIHAIFRAGDVKRDIPVHGESVEIPSDVLLAPGAQLEFGFCGYSQTGERSVIRTSAYSLGIIPVGVDCDCEKPGDPGVTVLQDLILQIGDIKKLETSNKSSLVAAVNEVNHKSNASTAVFADQKDANANSEELQRMVDTASAAGGGAIYIPAGTYRFGPIGTAAYSRKSSYCVKMRSNVEIYGDGPSTILMPVGTAPAGIDMFYYNLYRETVETGPGDKTPLVNCHYHDFTVEGIDAHSEVYSTAGKAFMLNVIKDCHWERVTVCNTDGTGLGVDCPVQCSIVDCVAYGCGKAAPASNPKGASGIGIGFGLSEDECMTIRGCQCYDNANYGIFYEHQRRFKPDWYKAAKNKGLIIADCSCWRNFNNYGAMHGINVSISNCVSTNAKNHGYLIENGELNRISSCSSNADAQTSYVMLQSVKEGGHYRVVDNVINGCVSKFCAYGVKLVRPGNEDASFARNAISSNTILAAKTNSLYISGEGMSQITVIGNIASGAGNAISVSGVTAGHNSWDA